MDLRQVKKGFALQWPDELGGEGAYAAGLRGRAGYVVDYDAAHERDWCKGQEHKLEAAAAGAVVAPLDHPKARRMRSEAERGPKKAEVPTAPQVGGDMPTVKLPAKAKAS